MTTTIQPDLFVGPVLAPPEAEAAREIAAEVLAQLEERHPDALTACRWAMRRLWLERYQRDPAAFVSADDVRDLMTHIADPGHRNNNWRGAIFTSEEWEWTGLWIQSRHVPNHARPFRAWRLKPEYRHP